ncbi:MAG TPA: hemerythrin domain-containing protein [Candidatus Nitrosotenuis sp.]|jgi:hemerythrin superfamily protein|nr:hemerythrin domain-containing protein [Candidatus Nitrosotenuis sp.]
MTDIYSYIKSDHQKVDDLFNQVLSTNDLVKRQKLFETIKRELILHAASENATFYSALEEHPEIRKVIEHGEEEHEVIKNYIIKLDQLGVANEEWITEFKKLKNEVTAHVKEEEGKFFKIAKDILSKKSEAELGKEMENVKKDLKKKFPQL